MSSHDLKKKTSFAKTTSAKQGDTVKRALTKTDASTEVNFSWKQAMTTVSGAMSVIDGHTVNALVTFFH